MPTKDSYVVLCYLGMVHVHEGYCLQKWTGTVLNNSVEFLIKHTKIGRW